MNNWVDVVIAFKRQGPLGQDFYSYSILECTQFGLVT